MKTLFAMLTLMLCFRPLWAGEVNVPREISQAAASGAVLAGGFTSLADSFSPKQRKWIGFLASSAWAMVGEGVAVSQGESWTISSQDMGAHILGAAAAAAGTDDFVLAPVVTRDQDNLSFTGIVLHKRF
jgi:hypothetical protein